MDTHTTKDGRTMRALPPRPSRPQPVSATPVPAVLGAMLANLHRLDDETLREVTALADDLSTTAMTLLTERSGNPTTA